MAGHVATWLAVAAAHAGLIGWFWLQSDPVVTAPARAALLVNFVREPAPQAVAAQPSASPPPPPAAPSPPKPEPRLIATPDAPPASTMATSPELAPAEPLQAVSTVAAAPQSAAVTGPGEPALTPPDFRAAYLKNQAPTYPMAARRRREQGIVMLKVHVLPTGEPELVQVDQSSGFPELDQAALNVVRRHWRFTPARQGDQPVAAWVAVPLQFTLKDR